MTGTKKFGSILCFFLIAGVAGCTSAAVRKSLGMRSARTTKSGAPRKYQPLNSVDANPGKPDVTDSQSPSSEVRVLAAAPNVLKSPKLVSTPLEGGSLPVVSGPLTPSLEAAKKYLVWLKYGNRRFREKLYRNDGADETDRLRSLENSKPHSVVWTCSDSRMPPEVIFDQKLDEIFVLRSFELQVDESIQRAFLHAATQLSVPLFVILGSEMCGDARPLASMMIDSSEALRKMVESGLIRIVTATYDPRSGKVRFY